MLSPLHKTGKTGKTGNEPGQGAGPGAGIIAEAGALDSRPWGGRHYRMLSPSQKVGELGKLDKGDQGREALEVENGATMPRGPRDATGSETVPGMGQGRGRPGSGDRRGGHTCQ
jgi:hypothetical protein